MTLNETKKDANNAIKDGILTGLKRKLRDVMVLGIVAQPMTRP
jgi:hypothetical protein